MIAPMMFALGSTALTTLVLLLQTPPPPAHPPKHPPAKTAPGPKALKAATTDAERIANTRESIRQSNEAIKKLQAKLAEPDGEYQRAEAEFEAINVKLKTTRDKIAALRQAGNETAAVAAEATLPGIQEEWQLAKERFNIAIRLRKASQQAIDGMNERIASDRQLLAELEGESVAPAPAPGPVSTPAPVAVAPEPGEHSPPPALTLPLGLGLPARPAPAPVEAAAPPALPAADYDPVVRAAQNAVKLAQAESNDALVRLHVIEERLRVTERSAESVRNILQLEQETVAQAERAASKLEETLKATPAAITSERDALAARIADTEIRLGEARERAVRIATKLAGLNETLAALQDERNLAAQDVEAHERKVAAAESAVADLLSPTAPRNLLKWTATKGPRVAGILLGMVILHLAARQFSRQVVTLITRHSLRGSPEDRINRANTLVGVVRYVAAIAVFGGGLVMLLDEIGLPVVPLMGGAAVIGLAVAFGTQNLIRDYFTGFMMLMEDQYSVNDVVRIGTISGLVEQISLRMTVLRDLEGVRHFIPHGTITSVSNLTHGWSRAKLDIAVAYKENVDRVIAVLLQVGRELRQDPLFGKNIWDDPEMLGVDDLGSSGFVIRFLVKTRPLQQWPVRRELLRRIKNKFDELGIEIPLPHQMVYHRFPTTPGEGSPAGRPADWPWPPRSVA